MNDKERAAFWLAVMAVEESMSDAPADQAYDMLDLMAAVLSDQPERLAEMAEKAKAMRAERATAAALAKAAGPDFIADGDGVHVVRKLP